MTTGTGRLTYEEYINVPEIMARFDIVDGEFIEYPKRTVQFQSLLGNICLLLDKFVSENKLGEVLPAPLDVLIQREPLRTRQPDVMFISNERRGIMKEIIDGGPDMVVEVLSLSRNRTNVEDKLADYARLGVRECWLVSPEGRTVEVLTLADGNWQRASLLGTGDQIRSVIFEDLEIEVSQLFV